MNFNGDDVSGVGENAKFNTVCTNELNAAEISVGSCTTALFTLPEIAPPAGVPGSRVVMTANQSSLAFVIPNVTFKFEFQDGVGNFHNVNVPVSAGTYDLVTDIFPIIENQFQVVLGGTISSGTYTCSLIAGFFNLALTGGVSIQQTIIVTASSSDNGYLGAIGNATFFGNSGGVTLPNMPTYTLVSNPTMQWEPYSLAPAPGVTNPMMTDLDGGGFGLKNMGFLNLNEEKTPVDPPIGAITLYADLSGNLNTLTSGGTNQLLTQNEILALDGSCNVTTSNGGTINYNATHNNFTGDMTLTNNIFADSLTNAFNFIFGACRFILSGSTPYIIFNNGTHNCLVFTSGSTVITGPDGVSGFTMNSSSLSTNTLISAGAGIQTNDIDYPGVMNIGSTNATQVVIGNISNTTTFPGNVVLEEAQAGANPVLMFRTGPVANIRFAQAGSTTDFMGVLTNNSNIVNYGMFSAIGNNTLGGTTTELVAMTSITGNQTIPANTIIPGFSLQFVLGGSITTAGTTLRIRIRGTTGGTTGNVYFDSGLLATTVADFRLTGSLSFRDIGGLTIADCNSNAVFIHGGTSTSIDYQNTTTVDTTVNNVITPTIQWTLATASLARRVGYFNRVF